MKRLLMGIVLAGMMVSAGMARADDSSMNVQKLVQFCNDPQSDLLCTGYIGGVGDMMVVNAEALKYLTPQAAKSMKALSVCSSDITYGAEVQVFKNWAQAHPEMWTQESAVGVMLALRGTWGCR
jgi:hypothetical protein